MFDGLKLEARSKAKWLTITAGLNASNVLCNLGLGRKSAGRGAIFTLHHVRPHEDKGFAPNAHLSVTPEFLDAAITTLVDAGYEPLALSSLPARLKESEPQKPFAIFTLDDGYRNNAEFAAPIFERHNVPFTVFVTKGFSERTHTIWWETLEKLVATKEEFSYDFGSGAEVLHTRNRLEKSLAYERIGNHIFNSSEASAIARLNESAAAAGISAEAIVEELILDREDLKALSARPLAHLGAHTVSHRAMAFLSDSETREEMLSSAIYVTEITGRRTGTFSYPYGFHQAVSARNEALSLECGFDLAVLTKPGTIGNDENLNLAALPRISLNGLYQNPRYVTALASGLLFKLMG